MDLNFMAGFLWGMGLGATVTIIVAIILWMDERVNRLEKKKFQR